jgi:heat shock protein HtpX
VDGGPARWSLAIRGCLAVGLMIGFYGLAALVVAALLYIPYAEYVLLERVDLRIAFFCVSGAGAVCWAVMPRPDRFVPPGPELRPSEQPKLFELLESVRAATGQGQPRHVYLDLQVNAWVSQRGGFMGVGSRRVMGLGLPLIQALTVEQLRAVVAHEFGHYHGGDTRLGPWIYNTRVGIARTLERLEDSVIRLPFVAYGRLFFRITNAVSRRQEFAADALAARVVSAQALIGGLKQAHRAAEAFGPFWQAEFAPALHYQVRPPLATGFARFLQLRGVAAGVDNALQAALATHTTDPNDSHPSLPERCAALERLGSTGDGDARPAIVLLSGLSDCERALLGIALDPELETLRQVEWREIPELVWYPRWREEVQLQAKVLADATVADAASLCQDPRTRARGLVVESGYLPGPEERIVMLHRVIAIAIAVALVDAGWTLSGDLGDPVMCTRERDTLEPFAAIARSVSGELTSEAWREDCGRLGISRLPLVPPARRAEPDG